MPRFRGYKVLNGECLVVHIGLGVAKCFLSAHTYARAYTRRGDEARIEWKEKQKMITKIKTKKTNELNKNTRTNLNISEGRGFEGITKRKQITNKF